jgi:microcystin-dependent protein
VSDNFVGQILMTGYAYAQRYSAQCNGQIMAITQNQALFSVLGSYYGGNGMSTFALPDLRSRTPAGALTSLDGGWQPPNYALGQSGGYETVPLSAGQLPTHIHATTTVTSDVGTSPQPPRGGGRTLGSASAATGTLYGPPQSLTPLPAAPLTQTGGNQPHPNIQPFETINFNVILYGIYPSRN